MYDTHTVQLIDLNLWPYVGDTVLLFKASRRVWKCQIDSHWANPGLFRVKPAAPSSCTMISSKSGLTRWWWLTLTSRITSKVWCIELRWSKCYLCDRNQGEPTFAHLSLGRGVELQRMWKKGRRPVDFEHFAARRPPHWNPLGRTWRPGR